MADQVKIQNLEGFISALKNQDEVPSGYVRFYRGQTSKWKLLPHAFRDDFSPDDESNFFYDIVNKKPDEFAGCKCTFDYLVKMQHYGIPTRLLDITSNPLVALFFALGECGATAPTVYIVDVRKDFVKNYMSDSITILSNLSRVGEDRKEVIEDSKSLILFSEKMRENLMNLKDEEKKSLLTEYTDKTDPDSIKWMNKLNTFIGLTSRQISGNPNKIDKSHEVLMHIVQEDCNNTCKNDSLFLSFFESHVDSALNKHCTHVKSPGLLHEIKQDKPYFEDIMHVSTFTNVFCVKPKLDNPRIIRQNGAFLIFPHKDVQLKEDNIRISTLDIDLSCVKCISDDLDRLDINKENLYNDMDTISKSITEKYKIKKSKEE